MKKEKVILYGSSKMGEEAFLFLRNKYEIIFFCDNDKKKWGSQFCGVKVISPSVLGQIAYKNYRVIIASMNSLEISIQLKNMNINNVTILQKIKDKHGNVSFLEYDLKETIEQLDGIQDTRKLKVACILDEFSYNCFKNECILIQINPINWDKVFEQGVDFLLVESAWQGLKGEWKGLLSYFSEGSDENNVVNQFMNKIINKCLEQGVPTVFWNKEDPVHYKKFIPLAKKFQYIFTTDSNMVQKYIEDVGHNRVFVLPFAANLNIHNPINKDIEKIGELAFAGSWYDYHEQRKIDMERTLLPALEFGVHIYDRNYGDNSNKMFMFPEIYRKNIVGKLPYNQMVEYYKKYKIFLNTNTVQNSPTMFSRRVFELLACGTNVISGYSLGIEKMLGDVVLIGKNSDEIKKHIKKLINDQVYSEKLSLLGIRKVIEQHTYTHRFNDITSKIKIHNYDEHQKGVSVITVLTDKTNLNNVIDNYVRQKFSNKELIILIKSDVIKREEIFDAIRDIKNVYLYKIKDKSFSSEYFKHYLQKSDKEYIAIFSERDYYAEYYLTDSLNAFKYSKADIVGKATVFEYCQSKEQLSIANPHEENRYSNNIFKNTIVFERKILFSNWFLENRISFKDICNIILNQDLKIYSIDKYNYIHLIDSKEEVDQLVLNKVNIKTAIEYISV